MQITKINKAGKYETEAGNPRLPVTEGKQMNEEVKDLLQNAYDALDEVLGLDDDKVPGELWDEVNDLAHKVEELIED